MIKRKLQKVDSRFWSTLHKVNVFRAEILLKQVCHQGTAVTTEFRGFNHCTVARGNNGNQWGQGQVNRIVPGRDDKADTFRLILNLTACAHHH
ncbi:hypothetical protein D3C87_1584180 [compost metagenome]